jgi:hypothetical protein
MDGRLSCRVRGPRVVPLTGRPISRAVLRAVPRADFEAQALARAGHEHGTSTKAVGPGRASVVPNRAVLVRAQRARPVWPPIAPVNPRNSHLFQTSPYGAIEITYVGIGDGEHVQPS